MFKIKQRVKTKVRKPKITGDDAKKTKRLTEIKVLIKEFTKRVFKKTKVAQLFKPINYCEVAASTRSN